MMNRILVTYASRSGTTAEIAAAIREALVPPGGSPAGEPAWEVEILPMEDVKDLSAYRAVIAGSAIRAGRWLPEAVQFVRTHQAALRHKPFAMFTVCITLAMTGGERYREAVAGWTAPVRAIVPPLSEGLFAGRLDFTRLPFHWDTLKLRLTTALGIFPRGDHRDWKAIHAWAESLRPMLSAPAGR